MNTLKKDWLTDGLIDFEYKKYILLAYLKEVKANFDSIKLYPFLADLILHYRNLKAIKENKKLTYDAFPREVSKADFEKLELNYQRIIEDDDVMKEIEEIIEFAMGKMDKTIKDGVNIFEFVEDNIKINPVGIVPLYADEGYVFFTQERRKEMKIYRYIITVFENSSEALRAINMKLLDCIEKSVFHTFEQIKMQLVKRHHELPNPATFHIYSQISLPTQETLLPVSKRLLVKHLNSYNK